ncbi:MAG TPA: hypothetical protein VFB63_20935 [Bryobacteraceae bacterium]|nr:hypothetical protein [Bryobacteraceae bacterium]
MRLLAIFLLFAAGLAASGTFLIKSVNAGKSWTDIDPGSPDRFLWWLQIDSRSSTLYALTQRDLGEEWHLSVSVDGGQTWQISQSFPREIYWISATAPAAPDTLYLAYELYGYPQKEVMIARVTDRGQTMEQYRAEGLAVVQDAAFIGFLTTLKADTLVPAKLYALVTKELCCTDDIFALFQALWMSVDGGRTWNRLEPPVADGCNYPEVEIDASDSSVYVACGNELFKSADGGASWTPKSFPNGERLWNLQAGPGATQALFGNRLGAIWKSTGGAATWQRLGSFPAESDQRSLTPHPINPSLIYASTRDGIAKSEDGGETWTVVTEYPLLADPPFRLLIDPQAPDTFYLVNWTRQQPRLGP